MPHLDSMYHNLMAQSLGEEFAHLAHTLRQLLSLLEEHDEQFWASYLRRGLQQVEQEKLAGATYVLGCYGGIDTFSDFRLTTGQPAESLSQQNADARLNHLRTAIFESASAIASRRHW